MNSDLTTSLDCSKRRKALKAAHLSHFEVVGSKKLIKKISVVCAR